MCELRFIPGGRFCKKAPLFRCFTGTDTQINRYGIQANHFLTVMCSLKGLGLTNGMGCCLKASISLILLKERRHGW